MMHTSSEPLSLQCFISSVYMHEGVWAVIARCCMAAVLTSHLSASQSGIHWQENGLWTHRIACCRKVVAQAKEALGQIDILVNNASYQVTILLNADAFQHA